jgi:hypothetical protein
LLRRLAVTIAVAVACSPALGGTADANCGPLEMRVMQLQSRNDPDSGELSEARSLLAQCNGTQSAAAFQSWGEIAPKDNPRRTERKQRRGPSNTVRTLCVRTCDGYYFPISFSTTRKHLEADEAACRRMCPAGDASLYYHSRRDGPERMVSIAGAPYTDLENAFRYRTVLDRSCTCGAPIPIEPTEVVLATYSDELAPAFTSVEERERVDRTGD